MSQGSSLQQSLLLVSRTLTRSNNQRSDVIIATSSNWMKTGDRDAFSRQSWAVLRANNSCGRSEPVSHTSLHPPLSSHFTFGSVRAGAFGGRHKAEGTLIKHGLIPIRSDRNRGGDCYRQACGLRNPAKVWSQTCSLMWCESARARGGCEVTALDANWDQWPTEGNPTGIRRLQRSEIQIKVCCE